MSTELGGFNLDAVDGRRFWLVERTFSDGCKQYHIRRKFRRGRRLKHSPHFRERVAVLPEFGKLEWETTVERKG